MLFFSTVPRGNPKIWIVAIKLRLRHTNYSLARAPSNKKSYKNACCKIKWLFSFCRNCKRSSFIKALVWSRVTGRLSETILISKAKDFVTIIITVFKCDPLNVIRYIKQGDRSMQCIFMCLYAQGLMFDSFCGPTFRFENRLFGMFYRTDSSIMKANVASTSINQSV